MYLEDCLFAHNKLRGLHKGTNNLSWDPVLAKQSQEWAEKLAKTGTFKHASYSERNGAGENIYSFASSKQSRVAKCGDAASSW